MTISLFDPSYQLIWEEKFSMTFFDLIKGYQLYVSFVYTEFFHFPSLVREDLKYLISGCCSFTDDDQIDSFFLTTELHQKIISIPLSVVCIVFVFSGLVLAVEGTLLTSRNCNVIEID